MNNNNNDKFNNNDKVKMNDKVNVNDKDVDEYKISEKTTLITIIMTVMIVIKRSMNWVNCSHLLPQR